MRCLTIILATLITTGLFSQNYAKIKFGKVDKEDLEMEVYTADSTAEAVVLNDLTKIWLQYIPEGSKVIYERHKRIKILTKEGIDQADIEIYYNSFERNEEITGLKVVVHQPDGSKYELKKNEKIKEKQSKWITSYKFNAPGVQEGSIIEYKYKLTSRSLWTLRDWNFQYEIPIRFCRLELDIPKYFIYATLVTNPGLIRQVDNMMTAVRVPAMKEESFITTMEDYRGSVKFQLKSFDNGQYREAIFSSWPEIANSLHYADHFGKQYTKKSNYKNLYSNLESVIKDSEMSDEEKILRIYVYILNNVKWDEQYSIFSTKSLNDAFNKGEGNSAELNLMMLAMLKETGIESYPVILSPRHLGKNYPFHPFISQFKTMMVQVKMFGEKQYLDLTDKWRAPGLPSTTNLNGDVWLVDPRFPKWQLVEPTYSEDVFFFKAKMNEDFDLEVDMNGKYVAYNAMVERKHHHKDSTGTHWQERLAYKFPDTEVKSASCENLYNLYEDFKDNVSLNIPGAATDAGNLLYIDPFLYSTITENPFKLDQRNYPVDFGYPFGERYIFQFEIPEGYEVDELPESIILKNPDNSAIFKMIASATGNMIQISKQLKIQKSKFTPAEYAALKGLYDRIIEKTGELIVLKKT